MLLRDGILWDLIYDDKNIISEDDPTRAHWRAKSDPPESVPQGLDISLETYRRFHRKAVEELDGWGVAHRSEAKRLALDLLSELLTPEDVALVERARKPRYAARTLLFLLLGPASWLTAGIATYWNPNKLVATAVIIALIPFLAILPTLALIDRSFRYKIYIFSWRLSEMIFYAFERFWRRQRPFHGFKILALALFFFGSLLDIVSD